MYVGHFLKALGVIMNEDEERRCQIETENRALGRAPLLWSRAGTEEVVERRAVPFLDAVEQFLKLGVFLILWG